jgi:hypothetical protein
MRARLGRRCHWIPDLDEKVAIAGSDSQRNVLIKATCGGHLDRVGQQLRNNQLSVLGESG